MSELFLKIVNMSISAGWLILAVLLCRLLLRKAPKWVNVLLWGIVAVRAVCPFSIESALSLIPSAETISPDIMMAANPAIHTGIPAVNSAVNPVISQSFTPSPGASVNPLQIWIPLFAIVWAVGVAGFLVYAAVSYWHLRRRVTTAVLLRDNIFQSENAGSPFVLGVIRPRIYLPFKMKVQDMEHVIAHERAHIRRRDHWWKPLGFLLLAVHWFNPLMWLSYVLLCRDIELACDEKVIRELDNERRADYTQALLSCSVSRRVIAACPLAFGEVGVKERVKSVMNYKKPAFWVIVAAVVVCVVVAVCFLTNPKRIDPQLTAFIDHEIEKHSRSPYSVDNFCCWDKEILGTTKKGDRTTVYMWVLYMEYGYGDYLEIRAGAHTPTAITVEGDGDYRLIEYWIPGDGSYYAPDIRSKFPWYLRWAAMDSQAYIEKQNAACIKAAREHFGVMEDPEPAPSDTEMIPTSANVQGVFGEYLFIPFGESGTYRYERTEADPSVMTVGELLYRFTEKADPVDVEWFVYSVKESPDHHIVCAAAGDDYVSLYQYSPSKKTAPNSLEEAKRSGCVIEENGEGTWGAELWEEFYEATQSGRAAWVKVAYYYTLDPEQCDEAYYEAYKEDYPSMHVVDLTYDGEKFTLSWLDKTAPDREYKYLMKYEDAVPYAPSPARWTVTRYVLTNDDTVTWHDLFMSVASSQSGAYIDHFSVFDYYAPTLSLDDVITLSRKGYDLGWADFEGFNHVDIGSGLYIWSFAIDERFSLRIGGGSTDTEPMYIRLRANDASDAYIDIRDGGVAEFIELHKKAPDVPDSVKYYLTVGADGVTSIELSAPNKTGGCQRADGSPFRKGEDVWLDSLDGLPDLRGVTITALNGNGETVWLASIPDGEENRGFASLIQDGWTITNTI